MVYSSSVPSPVYLKCITPNNGLAKGAIDGNKYITNPEPFKDIVRKLVTREHSVYMILVFIHAVCTCVVSNQTPDLKDDIILKATFVCVCADKSS